MSVEIAMLLLAAILAQEAFTLSFPTGGEIVYRETWRVTETGGAADLEADAERTVRLRVKETSRGRTRLEVKFENLVVRGANTGLNEDMRSWLDVPARDQWVSERGFVERKDEPRGNRPFFGLVLPPPGKSLPDRWTAKVLPPIGTERATDFVYRLDTRARQEQNLTILASAKDKVGDLTMSLDGTISVTSAGEVAFGDITTTLSDAREKTTTVIEYRFRKI